MKQFQKGIALVCSAALAASLAVCASAAETETEVQNEETVVEKAGERLLAGRVVSIDEDGAVTVELGGGRMGFGKGFGGKLDAADGELPAWEDGQRPERPEKPELSDDETRPERPERPEVSDDETLPERPERPDGEDTGKLSRTITFTAEEAEGLDLEVGSLVSVTCETDEDGNRTAVLTVLDETALPERVRPEGAELPEDGSRPEGKTRKQDRVAPEDVELPEGQDLPAAFGRGAGRTESGMTGMERSQDAAGQIGGKTPDAGVQGRMMGGMAGGPGARMV